MELDQLLRSRERTVKELEEHLRAALSMLTKRIRRSRRWNRGWQQPSKKLKTIANDSPRSSTAPSRGINAEQKSESLNPRRRLVHSSGGSQKVRPQAAKKTQMRLARWQS